MIFRKGSLTALIETESTVLGIRTHVGTVAGVYVYCPMAATNTVCCWCRSLEMLRISGPDLDSNNVPMLLQSVSLVSVCTELHHFLTNINYQLHSCSTLWMWIQASTSNCPLCHSFRIPNNTYKKRQGNANQDFNIYWLFLMML